MATLQERIQSAESRKRAFERQASDAKQQGNDYVKALQTAGIDKMTEDQSRMADQMFAKHREAVDGIKAAEGELKALREVEREEAEYMAKARERYPTSAALLPGAEGTVQVGARAGNLYGAPTTGDGQVWRYADTGRPAAVELGQRFGDHEVAREHASRMAEQDRMIVGTHGSLAQQIRALTTSGASAIVPTEWSFPIIDKVRNQAIAYQAGATLVPMPAKVVQIGRLTQDVSPSFKTEGSAITPSDVAFDYVQLTATSLAALTVASLEFLADAPNADSIVSEAIAQAIALELDKAVMFGQLGATGTNDEGSAYGLASPYPKGILKNLLDNASGQVLGFATNGTAQTNATPWNELIGLVYQVKRQNEQCNVIVSNDRLVQQYMQMYDTTYQPLRRPEVLANMRWLTTNAIPSFTRGTMTSKATDVFAGDFCQVLIGERMSLEVRALTERYAENGQVGILAYWRGDVQVARPNALACYRAIQGAA